MENFRPFPAVISALHIKLNSYLGKLHSIGTKLTAKLAEHPQKLLYCTERTEERKFTAKCYSLGFSPTNLPNEYYYKYTNSLFTVSLRDVNRFNAYSLC